MVASLRSRLDSTRVHDDGVDEWRMTGITAPAALAGLIGGYSDYAERTGSFTTRREVPHAQGVLLVNLADPIEIVSADGRAITVQTGAAFVAGPQLRPALSRSTGRQSGMHVFLPLASLRRLIGVPMEQLVDRVIPLDALLGGREASFCRSLVEARYLDERIAILDAALIRRFAATPALAPAQLHALSLLRDRPELDIAAVARLVGWSRKHLARRVHDAVGVGPRTLRRLIRFERLTQRLEGIGAPNWAALALDAGYCDQQHMSREFREFAGVTPGGYVARSLPAGGGLVDR